MPRPSSGSFLLACKFHIRVHFFLSSHRHWQEQAATAEAKLQALNSRLGELRERFKQAQREVQTLEVRINLT
jgi:chromosome segregation ATPase